MQNTSIPPSAGAVASGGSSDIGYDIIILAGQSNMSGQGLAFNLTNYDPIDPRIFQYGDSGVYAKLISMAIEPLAYPDSAPGMGPGLVFARWYAHSIPVNRRILLVPCAYFGTGFGQDNNYTWLPGDTAVANLFNNMISQTQAALAAAGPNSRIVAACWLQGETDGDDNVAGSVYQANLDLLITTLRSELNLPNLPFVVGQMVPDYLSTGTRAQINAVHINTPANQLYCGFGYGPSGMNNGDGNHYNAPGQRVVGLSMFRAYQMALVNAPYTAPVPVTGLTLVQSGTTVNMTWNRPICRITNYLTQYSLNGGVTWTTLSRTQGIDPSATLIGMTLGSEVMVSVSTVNDNTAGSNTAAPAIASIALAVVPAQVTGLSIPTPTQTTINAAWNAVAGVTQYQVQYMLASGSTWINGPLVNTTSATFSVPYSSALVNFQVCAVNAAGSGTPSSTVSVTTGIAPGVLDSLATPSWGAYGVRKLRTAYAGAAINVRRSSDNTTMDIGFNTGTLDLNTAALLTFAGSGSAYITTYYDQSGNGRNLTQATAADQPIIVNAGALVEFGTNSRAAPLFNGTSDYLTRVGAGLYASGASTCVGVFGSASLGLLRSVLMEGNTTEGNTYYAPMLEDDASGANLTSFIRNDADSVDYNFVTGPPPAAFDGNLHQCEVDDSGTSITTYVDGTPTNTGSYTRSGTLTVTNISMGAVVRSTVSNWFNGYILEMLTFGSVISLADRTAIRADQKSYYGTN
jgi:hypothetical protein